MCPRKPFEQTQKRFITALCVTSCHNASHRKSWRSKQLTLPSTSLRANVRQTPL